MVTEKKKKDIHSLFPPSAFTRSFHFLPLVYFLLLLSLDLCPFFLLFLQTSVLILIFSFCWGPFTWPHSHFLCHLVFNFFSWKCVGFCPSMSRPQLVAFLFFLKSDFKKWKGNKMKGINASQIRWAWSSHKQCKFLDAVYLDLISIMKNKVTLFRYFLCTVILILWKFPTISRS